MSFLFQGCRCYALGFWECRFFNTAEEKVKLLSFFVLWLQHGLYSPLLLALATKAVPGFGKSYSATNFALAFAAIKSIFHSNEAQIGRSWMSSIDVAGDFGNSKGLWLILGIRRYIIWSWTMRFFWAKSWSYCWCKEVFNLESIKLCNGINYQPQYLNCFFLGCVKPSPQNRWITLIKKKNSPKNM